MRIVLRGTTEVVKNHLEDDEEQVTSPDILQMLALRSAELESMYDNHGAFSQYCDDGSEFATTLLKRIKFGGWVRLVYDELSQKLFVETEYESNEALTEAEIQFLAKETVGQWSDGAGAAAMDIF